MITIKGINFYPYRTLYEQYLKYPVVTLRMRGEETIMPNGIIPLYDYPASMENFYFKWLDAIQDSDESNTVDMVNLSFQLISEATIFKLGLPQIFVMPNILEGLLNTRLDFKARYLAEAFTKTGPYILNLPEKAFMHQRNDTYLSSILVDFQTTSGLAKIAQAAQETGRPEIFDKERLFLVFHYWWYPLPKDRHPGEVKADTTVVVLDPEETLNAFFGRAIEEIALPEEAVSTEVARKLYSLIAGTTLLLAAKSDVITPITISNRIIKPEARTIAGRITNNTVCPCSGDRTKSFRQCCKKRLKPQRIVRNQNFLLGEIFEKEIGGVLVPPHFQTYWHKKLPDGTIVEEAFPVLHHKAPYAYEREKIPVDIKTSDYRERSWLLKKIAGRQKPEPPLEPIIIDEAEEIERFLRDTQMVRYLKTVYDDTCQMCGYRVTRPDGRGYSIGAHIMPFGEFPHLDIPENILILCPLHHDEFDLGIIQIDTTRFYQIKDEREALQLERPEDKSLLVPSEYIYGFTIKHHDKMSTYYSRAIHDKTLMVMAPGSSVFPQGHKLNPFFFEYRLRKWEEIESELGGYYYYEPRGSSLPELELRRNPVEFDEIAAELLELNHPFVRDLAVAHGFTYATARDTDWFFKMIVNELEEEFTDPEQAEEELDLFE